MVAPAGSRRAFSSFSGVWQSSWWHRQEAGADAREACIYISDRTHAGFNRSTTNHELCRRTDGDTHMLGSTVAGVGGKCILEDEFFPGKGILELLRVNSSQETITMPAVLKLAA
jgi:hypothetical protein